jgi:cobyric acid synthase
MASTGRFSEILRGGGLRDRTRRQRVECGLDMGFVGKPRRIQGTYLHGLFASDGFRRAYLATFDAAMLAIARAR